MFRERENQKLNERRKISHRASDSKAKDQASEEEKKKKKSQKNAITLKINFRVFEQKNNTRFNLTECLIVLFKNRLEVMIRRLKKFIALIEENMLHDAEIILE